MKYIIIMSLILFSNLEKKLNCEYWIYYKCFDLVVNDDDYEMSNLRNNEKLIHLSGDSLIRFKNLNCRGRADVEFYIGDKIIQSGTFKETEEIYDDLHCYSSLIRDTADYMGEYLMPVKDGIWEYYNIEGKVIKREKWELGVMK